MSQVYVNNLTAEQKANIAAILAEAKNRGIVNKNALTSLLSIASKETEFKAKTESLYYSAQRITEVWPSISLSVAKTLEHNEEKLGNYVYGPTMKKSLGNGPNEGFKFRGRSFGQTTGKSNYEAIGKRIGVDLVSNPDRANEPAIAAKIFVDYYISAFEHAKKIMVKRNGTSVPILSTYNTTDINGFKTLPDSVNAFYDATRGWGNAGKKDTTGGYAKATERAPFLAQLIDTVKENKTGIAGAAFFLGWQLLAMCIENL